MGTKQTRQLGRGKRARQQRQSKATNWLKMIKFVGFSTLWFAFSSLTGVAIGILLGLMAAKPNADLEQNSGAIAEQPPEDSSTDEGSNAPAPPSSQPNPSSNLPSTDQTSDQESLLVAEPPSTALPAFVATALPQANGRPRIYPQPEPAEEWTCEVVVIGGSLGGIAAASHAMQGGAQTCLIEVTPWFGGQISSQGVSAIDESWLVIDTNHISPSWGNLLQHIRDMEYTLPQWAGGSTHLIEDINSCWVGQLCFPPQVGAQVALERLQEAAIASPDSRWATKTAFKGADFDASGQEITAIHAVRRVPRQDDYVPKGNLWRELPTWYSWSDDADFEKIPLRLVPPPGESMVVIDATDTGELVAWAKIPHRQGSESRQITGEPNAPTRSNPQCTQAFTFPFALAIHDDQQASLEGLKSVDSEYNVREHFREYSLKQFPMFSGRSFFNYRRMISVIKNSATHGTPIPGDVALVNWNPGNDWNWMNPPLILTEDRLVASRQYTNWMGGISVTALRHGESHALLFARWLIETQTQPGLPLSLWTGADAPMGTESGLSMVPYFREGRRILGRSAYGQDDFMISEFDIRWGFSGYRDMRETSVAIAHYDVDIHGCRYRNWEEPWEAASAPTHESNVRPIHIPVESLVPQGVNNMLVGGKALAVTHIVNAVTRVHSGEWAIGGASGGIAAWLTTEAPPELEPSEIVEQGYMPELKRYLQEQGLQTDW